jgi:hypothetical protein
VLLDNSTSIHSVIRFGAFKTNTFTKILLSNMSGGGLANRCDEGTGPREFQCNKSTKSGDQNSKKPL